MINTFINLIIVLIKDYNNHARLTGTFFLTAFVGGITGLSFLGPVREIPLDLNTIAEKGTEIYIGIIGIFLMAFSTALIAVSMYPVLRKKNEGASLASVVFRTIESTTYLIGITCWYAMVRVSQLFVDAGSPTDDPFYQRIGEILYEIQKFPYNVTFFVIGAFIYYFLFYQTKLIPRWLAAWGMIAVMFNLFSFMFHLFGVFAAEETISIIFELPLAMNELVIAVWLIVKGYNSTALEALNNK